MELVSRTEVAWVAVCTMSPRLNLGGVMSLVFTVCLMIWELLVTSASVSHRYRV